MLFQMFIFEFEVETSNEYLWFRVFVNHFFLFTFSIFGVCSLNNNVRIRFWYQWVLTIFLKLLLLDFPWLLHQIWPQVLSNSSRSSLSFNIVICRFDIYSLVINVMSLIRINWKKLKLIFLSLLLIFKLHLDKTKATTSGGGPISHDNRIYYYSILFKILDEIRFDGLKGETSHKKFNLIIRSFNVERILMSLTPWH